MNPISELFTLAFHWLLSSDRPVTPKPSLRDRKELIMSEANVDAPAQADVQEPTQEAMNEAPPVQEPVQEVMNEAPPVMEVVEAPPVMEVVAPPIKMPPPMPMVPLSLVDRSGAETFQMLLSKLQAAEAIQADIDVLQETIDAAQERQASHQAKLAKLPTDLAPLADRIRTRADELIARAIELSEQS